MVKKRGKKGGEAEDEKLERLLQQIRRKFCGEAKVLRPNDAAAAAIGRELGRLVPLLLSGDTGEILDMLQTEIRTLHLSIPHAFFHSVACEILVAAADETGDGSSAFDFLPEWVLTLEDSYFVQSRQDSVKEHVFQACLRAFALHLVYSCKHVSKLVLQTWKRFQRRTTHWQSVTVLTQFLSPLLAVTLLNPSCTEKERTLSTLQRLVWNQCWNVWSTRDRSLYLQWMLAAYDVMTLTSCCDLEILEDFVQHWTELASGVQTDSNNLLAAIRTAFLTQHVPRFLHVSNGTISSGVIDAFSDLMCETQATTVIGRFRLTSHALVTSVVSERLAVFQLISAGTTGSNLADVCQIRLLLALVSVLLHDPDCRPDAIQLRTILRTRGDGPQRDDTTPSLLKLLGCQTGDAASSLMSLVTSIQTFTGANFSARQQLALMLFGVLLLDEVDGKQGLRFLRLLLASYPHLAITLLPIVMERIHQASNEERGDVLMTYLEFMCESLSSDSHCAQEIWNLVGDEWMQPYTSPLTLRIALVRLFPQLVQGNKRLYRRVIEVIGVCLGGNEIGLRLAAAASIAEMAKEDNIRDVSDVVGWVQKLLTEDVRSSPVHALLVHHAVLSLHYLVLAEELDFNVVIKVLNKKLCSIADHAALMQQPLVVIEALMLLLGDGEIGENNINEDEGAGQFALVQISPQISDSVRALIATGLAARELSHDDDETSYQAILRIRRNVCTSLSRYSFRAL
jgi:hypothetical protein